MFIFALAVIIPGGLIIYFAVVAHKRYKRREAEEAARKAFMDMYPPLSLRAKSRRKRLDRLRAYRKRKNK